jgi:DNA repair protein RecO (recombination protein O)
MKRTRAFTLRQYPFREADRLVVFFSEDLGILRGVARGSLKLKSKVTGALEPMTLVNLRFVEPHGRELVIVTGCDAVRSLFHHVDSLPMAAAVGLITEIACESHMDRDPDPPFFRLLDLAQRALKAGVDPDVVMRYFELFTLKLLGLLPPPEHVRVEEARALMGTMLRTNLLDLPTIRREDLRQLGNYLRLALRDALGKQLRAYGFIDQMKSHSKT